MNGLAGARTGGVVWEVALVDRELVGDVAQRKVGLELLLRRLHSTHEPHVARCACGGACACGVRGAYEIVGEGGEELLAADEVQRPHLHNVPVLLQLHRIILVLLIVVYMLLDIELSLDQKKSKLEDMIDVQIRSYIIVPMPSPASSCRVVSCRLYHAHTRHDTLRT